MLNSLKSVKLIVFVVGIFLINYVGGIPEDSRNLFITHTIFLAPLLIDFFPLLKINNIWKWPIKIFWAAGILALITNILGVVGIIQITDGYNVLFSSGYYSIFNMNMPVNTFLLLLQIVYALIFTGTLTLTHHLSSTKEYQFQKQNNSGKELQKHAHS